MTNKKTQIILVQHRVKSLNAQDSSKDSVSFRYRIAKLVGDTSVSCFSFRTEARVGDWIDEAHAKALASVREYTVTVTQQQEAE